MTIAYSIKAQFYVTNTVQISNPPPCTLCCNGSISITVVSSLCPGPSVVIGLMSPTTGTTINWMPNFSGLCNGIYTVVVSGMDPPPCDGIVICMPYYPITTKIKQNGQGNLSSISIYPNPVNDILSLQFTNEDFDEKFTKLEIVNSSGQVIREEEINFKNNKTSIKTDDLPNGVYLLKLKPTLLGTAQSNDWIGVSKRFVIAR